MAISLDIDAIMEIALNGDYTQIDRIGEFPPALQGGTVQSQINVNAYRIKRANYNAITKSGYSLYSMDIISGTFARGCNGPVKCLEFRTPVSCVSDSSYNSQFVSDCAKVCDFVQNKHPDIGKLFDIKCLNGYVMAFGILDEEFFLSLPFSDFRECIAFWLETVETMTSEMRAILKKNGYLDMKF